MTQKTLSGIILTMVFSLASYAAIAAGHTAKTHTATTSKEVKSNSASDQTDAGKKMPVSADSHSKLPHGKAQAPHMEELPHLHKFHKERVKKIKKHHGKYWFLSQVIIVLCHLSILVIGYLHATH
jgi:anti-sigma28 factor (negative regulator of flagellin synthesis)